MNRLLIAYQMMSRICTIQFSYSASAANTSILLLRGRGSRADAREHGGRARLEGKGSRVAEVEFCAVSRRFGDVVALHGLDLSVADGEFLILVGPSGCGKSTALRLLAGLDKPTSGEIKIGGRTVAIKLLKEGIDNDEIRRRFMQEANAAGVLEHENIVRIFDVWLFLVSCNRSDRPPMERGHSTPRSTVFTLRDR